MHHITEVTQTLLETYIEPQAKADYNGFLFFPYQYSDGLLSIINKVENQSCIETAASAKCSTIGLCFPPISTKQEWNCYTSPKVPTDVRCGFYVLEKTPAYSGKKLFAGLKSSMQEQLKKACEYIKKAFRIEQGKTGLKSPKNMSEDRFKSQG